MDKKNVLELVNLVNKQLNYNAIQLVPNSVNFIESDDIAFMYSFALRYTQEALDQIYEKDNTALEDAPKIIAQIITESWIKQPMYSIPENPAWLKETRYITDNYYLVDKEKYQDPDYPGDKNPFTDQIHSLLMITSTDMSIFVTFQYLAQ